jgi:hypothetical protein
MIKLKFYKQGVFLKINLGFKLLLKILITNFKTDLPLTKQLKIEHVDIIINNLYQNFKKFIFYDKIDLSDENILFKIIFSSIDNIGLEKYVRSVIIGIFFKNFDYFLKNHQNEFLNYFSSKKFCFSCDKLVKNAFVCKCKNVLYCSNDCLESDTYYHHYYCSNVDEKIDN